MKLYRSVVGKPWTGAGSFWSQDPDVARKYGRRGGKLIAIEATGRALKLDSDEELIAQLARAGVLDAEERVYAADWLDDDVFESFRSRGIDWIVRPVDPSVSMRELEWIYVGEETHRIVR